VQHVDITQDFHVGLHKYATQVKFLFLEKNIQPIFEFLSLGIKLTLTTKKIISGPTSGIDQTTIDLGLINKLMMNRKGALTRSQ
jgi:hypothetical protein